MDRAYRIGQSRDVIVYRLISCGTVEEKIYRKQVFKAGLSRTGTEHGEQFRYFSQTELRDLFRIEGGQVVASATQRTLHDLHAHQRRETPELREHLHFLEGLEGFAGAGCSTMIVRGAWGACRSVRICACVPVPSHLLHLVPCDQAFMVA